MFNVQCSMFNVQSLTYIFHQSHDGFFDALIVFCFVGKPDEGDMEAFAVSKGAVENGLMQTIGFANAAFREITAHGMMQMPLCHAHEYLYAGFIGISRHLSIDGLNGIDRKRVAFGREKSVYVAAQTDVLRLGECQVAQSILELWEE